MNSCIKRTKIPIDSFGAGTTMHSNPQFKERNNLTGEANRIYYMKKIYGDDEHYNCYPCDLQRRIDHDWMK